MGPPRQNIRGLAGPGPPRIDGPWSIVPRSRKDRTSESGYCSCLAGGGASCARPLITLPGTHTHTHTPVLRPFSGTTRVSRYRKGKTSLDFTGARDSEWQWHQLDHVQVCTSLQTDNHASTPPITLPGTDCNYRLRNDLHCK